MRRHRIDVSRAIELHARYRSWTLVAQVMNVNRRDPFQPNSIAMAVHRYDKGGNHWRCSPVSIEETSDDKAEARRKI